MAVPDEMNIDIEFSRFSPMAQIFFIRIRQEPVIDTGQNGIASASSVKGAAFPFDAKFTESVIIEAFIEVWHRRWLFFYQAPDMPGVPLFHISKWAIYDKRKKPPKLTPPAPGDATAGYNPFDASPGVNIWVPREQRTPVVSLTSTAVPTGRTFASRAEQGDKFG